MTAIIWIVGICLISYLAGRGIGCLIAQRELDYEDLEQ